jgi:hypothetical protein
MTIDYTEADQGRVSSHSQTKGGSEAGGPGPALHVTRGSVLDAMQDPKTRQRLNSLTTTAPTA